MVGDRGAIENMPAEAHPALRPTIRCAPHDAKAIRLLERANACEQAGIARERICLDYGFGFAKTVDQNFELLAHTDRFAHLPYPILVGLSRKSSLGAITGREVNERSYCSVAGTLIAAQKGASVVRVHDVAATVDAFKIWLKTESSR